MRIYLILFLIALTYISCSEEPIEPPDFDPEPLDLLERLQNLVGVEVTEIAPDGPYVRAFQIYITQPVDHNNPGGQTFTQRVYLSHLDESAPMILVTWGYNVGSNTSQQVPTG